MCANDIASLRDGVLLPLLGQQKRDVVILAHSYGAIIASGAAKGLEKPARAKNGQPGGVTGLIYVAGNIVLDDESLGKASGGVYPPFIKLDKVRKPRRNSWGVNLLTPNVAVQGTSPHRTRRAGPV